MERLRFRSLASGSSGNCYFIGNASCGILIDAGVGVRTIRRFLKTMGLDFHNIWGVFVTHDHVDHIRAIGSIGEKYSVPVYTTRKVHEGINRSYCVTQKLSTSQRFLEVGAPIMIGDFIVNAFPVSHDATDSVGYSVEYRGKRLTVATDLGYVSDEVARNLIASDFMVLEANYDEQMLTNGSYPYMLKERIKAKTGHMCNKQTATFLADYYSEKWKYVFLCHLSKDNNHPDIAYTTIVEYMKSRQIDFEDKMKIIPLERMTPSDMFVFD